MEWNWDYIFPRKKKIIIWGAGENGKMWLAFLRHIKRNVICFFDVEKKGNIDQVPIYSPRSNATNDSILLISPMDAIDEIFEDAQSLGFHDIKIGELLKMGAGTKKYVNSIRCLDRWMRNRERGRFIADYLKQRKYATVAIYGKSMMGSHLAQELNEGHIHFSWITEQDVRDAGSATNMSQNESNPNLQAVDLIIITEMSCMEEIEFRLLQYTNTEIVSIEEIIDLMYMRE